MKGTFKMGAKAKPADDVVTVGGSLMHSREPDFSGWATKNDLKCADGRTIMKDAFAHQDATTVPLVWMHQHDEVDNVLGHAILTNKSEGVWCDAFFNESDNGKKAGVAVEHGDIKWLSIFANGLVEKGKNVLHGMIREVSLVLAGANPGASIMNVSVAHGAEIVVIDDEAVIYTGLELSHSATPDDELEHAEDGPTIQEVYDAMDDTEKNVVHYMVGAALEEAKADTPAAEHSAVTPDEKSTPDPEGTTRMTRNLFEAQNKDTPSANAHVLSHDAMQGILADAVKHGSFKDAARAYVAEHKDELESQLKHGIDSIEILFPDARAVESTPDFDKRRTEWVAGVMNRTKKSPFTRIKNFWADITLDDARAKGYVKGSMKKEEWFGVAKRTTGPATVYKKQALDRDDILDITDFDVVLWMKGEMRLMLEEELARAILIGDGREIDDPDKIKDPAGASSGDGIRSILMDNDLYAATINVNIDDANSSYTEVIDEIIRGQALYKGSGSPVFYTTLFHLTSMLLLKDTQGRRLYRTKSELAAELMVSDIVTVEVMEGQSTLIGIIVNLMDYTLGTDKGGDITSFEDFDIDYNKHKYLIETRLSGALTKIRSALIIKKVSAGAALVVPQAPDFVKATGVITPKTTTGVTYKRADTNATVTTGAPITLAAGTELKIYALPASASYYFENNVNDQWTLQRPAA